MEMPQTTICGAGIESIRRKIRWYFENVSCGHECRPRAPAASITFWMNIPRSSQLPISSRRSMVTIRPIGAPIPSPRQFFPLLVQQAATQ